MGMVVQHNMSAQNAYNRLNANITGLKKASEKLASGYRINRSADDAAGLAISEKMRAQIRGLNQGIKNASDGLNLCQVADGALSEVHNMLNRLEELSAQAANGTYDNSIDRAAIQLEVDQILEEIDDIAYSTTFNGLQLFASGEKPVSGGGSVNKPPQTPGTPETPGITDTPEAVILPFRFFS